MSRFLPHFQRLKATFVNQVNAMHHIANGYRGLTVLVDVNWDRIVYIGTIILALAAGAFVGSL
ncbi:MAG: hypothetical protein AAGK79_03870 [Pseudomonadota bacterium]